MHKADGSEMQYYDKTIDIPEFFVVDVGNVNVIFMVVFAASPDAIKTWDSTHAHNNFELQCMVENSAERLVDNSRKYTLHNGDLMLLPPHMLHKSCTHPSLFGCYCINFSIIPPSAEKSAAKGNGGQSGNKRRCKKRKNRKKRNGKTGNRENGNKKTGS